MVAVDILQELERTSDRLLGIEPELYFEVDRDRSEAEFRVSVVAPLLAIAIMLSLEDPYWGFACIAPVLLLVDGSRRAAGDALCARKSDSSISCWSVESNPPSVALRHRSLFL